MCRRFYRLFTSFYDTIWLLAYPVKERPDEFLPACNSGDLQKVKRLTWKFGLDLNAGLFQACHGGHISVAEYLIDQGANNFDDCLRITCQAGNLALSELLVQKGARPIVGLRATKSINIIKMLERYETKAEMIK